MKRKVAVIAVALVICACFLLLDRDNSPRVANNVTPTDSVRIASSELRIPENAGTSSSRISNDQGQIGIALTTTRGVTLNTDGLSARELIDQNSRSARGGDAVASYRVYQVEAMCNQIARQKSLVDSLNDGDQRNVESNRLQLMDRTCSGISPAELQERFTFLDTAIKAGNREAMVDYRMEGPNGMELENVGQDDPNVQAWKRNANNYLVAAASMGDETALATLALDYQLGVVTTKDLSQSIKYQTALVAGKSPLADPTKTPFMMAMISTLDPSVVQDAIEQGRSLAKQIAQRKSGASS